MRVASHLLLSHRWLPYSHRSLCSSLPGLSTPNWTAPVASESGELPDPPLLCNAPLVHTCPFSNRLPRPAFTCIPCSSLPLTHVLVFPFCCSLPCFILSSSRPPSSHQGDTCESLAAYFSLSTGCPFQVPTCAAAFQALNPRLDCSSSSGELPGSQAVCVERRAESAAALLIPVCSQFYLVQAGETCDQIRSVPSPPLSPLEFFRLNPGIKCSRLVPKTDVSSITGFEFNQTLAMRFNFHLV
ncbi:unnamed protein product [Closterium sp. Naga37s-1]|nr:unnamed protein product [Closterium sp. Naga37s-1]